jgi:hypothetical protein
MQWVYYLLGQWDYALWLLARYVLKSALTC